MNDKKLSILIAEDDIEFANYLCMSLGKLGHSITAVNSADKAIKKQDEIYDLFITDINMPGKFDGIDAANIISKNNRVPVIIMSTIDIMIHMNRIKIANWSFIEKTSDIIQKINKIIASNYCQEEKSVEYDMDMTNNEDLNIMVVDDDKDILKSFEIGLGKKGFNLTLMSDPLEALEIYEKKKFDVIITDIGMPGISGIYLLNKIKEIDPGTKVFIMTAYSIEENMKITNFLKADRLFTKPLNLAELNDSLATIKERKFNQKY